MTSNFIGYYEATMKNSAKLANREIFKRAMANLEEHTYDLTEDGGTPKSLVDEIIESEFSFNRIRVIISMFSDNGAFDVAFLAAIDAIKSLSVFYEKNSPPMRISKVPYMEGCSAYLVPEFAPWKDGIKLYQFSN